MIAALSRSNGIPLRYANRHGLITGATGTGKTVSLMRLAESFSSQGVPVFISDVKGDIAALSRSCPAAVLDVFGQSGQPLKSTVAAFGPDLMARALELTDTQAGCLEIGFAWSRDTGFPLHSLADLRQLLQAMAASPESMALAYGQVSRSSIGVIQRALLRLETQGGKQFFGLPQFDIAALLQEIWDNESPINPRGLVSILDSVRLISSPRVYAAFLLWLLQELWERLPEIGDCDKPRLVMFFDEAHLLFADCPAALLRRIEQTVRLIRSKGVGVYFVSQSVDDVPQIIRQQLAHTVAHDRSLAVGTARFQTMTAAGQPAKPVTVRVDLPACPLGALSESEMARFAPLPELPLPAAGQPSLSSVTTACGLVLAAVAAMLWKFSGMTWTPIGIGLAAAFLTMKP